MSFSRGEIENQVDNPHYWAADKNKSLINLQYAVYSGCYSMQCTVVVTVCSVQWLFRVPAAGTSMDGYGTVVQSLCVTGERHGGQGGGTGRGEGAGTWTN